MIVNKRKLDYEFLKYLLLCVVMALPHLMYSQVPSDQPVKEKKVYKTIALTKLKLYIYQPSERNGMEKLPAIVFFHGGGFNERHTWQFEPQCKYLVERGMVAVHASYRVRSRPFECVADAKSAIRWIRAHATEFGIDENRIAAGGGSAGAYLAACTALIKDIDEKNEDMSISSVPNALVLFNPRLDMIEGVPTATKGLPTATKKLIRSLKGRAIEISPFHNVSKGAPPTIIFHGTADESMPFHQVTRFCAEMKKYGNNCEVVLYEGREHGFFHYFLYPEGDNPDFLSTMEYTVNFLTSIGYINGDATIKK